MTLSEPAPNTNAPVSKPLAGLTFVIFWAIAIVLWSITHLFVGHALQGFLVDCRDRVRIRRSRGPVPAHNEAATAPRSSSASIGIVLFAIFGFGEVTVFVYTLRLLVPAARPAHAALQAHQFPHLRLAQH